MCVLSTSLKPTSTGGCSVYTNFVYTWNTPVGTRWLSLLRHCNVSRKVESLIPDGVVDVVLPVVPWHRLIGYQEYFLRGKGGRFLGQKILPL